MVTLAEIGNLRHHKDAQLLAETALWRTNIYRVSRLQILCCYKSLCLQNPRDKVHAAFDAITSECLQQYIEGNLEANDLAHFTLPSSPMTAEDALGIVFALPQMERAALLFALAESLNLDEVIKLRRRDLYFRHWSFLGARILQHAPAHVHYPLVFWRQRADGSPAPLLHLVEEIERLGRRPWVALRSEIVGAITAAGLYDSVETLLPIA
jgi:hypothetical protein